MITLVHLSSGRAETAYNILLQNFDFDSYYRANKNLAASLGLSIVDTHKVYHTTIPDDLYDIFVTESVKPTECSK